MKNTIKTSLFSLFLIPTFISLSIASEVKHVSKHQVEPVELLVDFKISSVPTGIVGSICYNGILNFKQNAPSVLTGSSKCTITLHTPANPDLIS